ncbi:hypothetical protein D3C76_149990 [compost metagenome]
MKRKIGKWLKVSLVALLVIILLGVGVVYAFVIKRPTQIAEYADTKPYVWNRVELSESVRSSDGSDRRFPYRQPYRQLPGEGWQRSYSEL